MARSLGYKCKLYLDAFDRSADTVDFTGESAADTIDVTSWGSAGWHAFDTGLKGGTINFNFMWNPSIGAIGPQLTALLGTTGIPTVDINENGAIGDSALVLPPSILEKQPFAIKPADIIRQPVSFKVSGAMGLGGVMCHKLTQETATGNSTSVDNTTSSANGGRCNMHFSEITGGAVRVILKHSTDDSTYTTLVDSGSQASVTALSTEVTGTVNRYLRITVSVIATSATFAVAFARY